MLTKKLRLVLDKTSMPADRFEIRREALRTVATTESISYEKPPENLADLVELRNLPLISVIEVAKNGGKDLSPEVKAFGNKGYKFYQANLGVNLGPSTKYKFVQAQLVYELLSDESSRLTIFDIFPQTAFEEKLKISGSVGLDLGVSYKVPISSLPLEAGAKAKFAIEPKPWVWKVATVESTGQGTLKARWLFKIDESVADLLTSIVMMTKSNPPISVNIGGWIEIDPGILHQNYYYNIVRVKVMLEE
jgi:hypothetical protein